MALPSLLRSTVLRRTLVVVALLVSVAAAVIGLVGWHANRILTQETSAAIDADIAELRAAFRERGIDALAAAIADRSRLDGPNLYRLVDASGRLRAGNVAESAIAFEGGERAGTFRYRRAGAVPGSLRTGAGVLIDIDGEAHLVVGRDIEGQRSLLHAIYRSVGLGAAMLAGLGLAGGLLLARYILRRIDTMAEASAGIMGGNFGGRIPVDGSSDELDRLAVRLNEMLARIEQLMAGLREVSDSIAHDLRTPINRLRNRAEAALADARGPPAWREGLEHVVEDADDIVKTFNALLLIARLEAGTAPDQVDRIDLADIVRDLVELYEPVAEEAGFVLSGSAAEALPVCINRQLIGQALTNLIDNALKYGRRVAEPERRRIDVAAHREGAMAVVVVADHGPGISPADRERALKRFVRLEQSRSEPGTGLGLSLVAAVAAMHGGSVRLEDNAPGLRAVVRLPLAAADMPRSPPSEPAGVLPAS